MAKQVGSESLKRRLQSVDFEFVETLREILDATQVTSTHAFNQYLFQTFQFVLSTVHSLSLLSNVLISASSELPNSDILPLLMLAEKICVTLHCFFMAFL